MASNQSQAQAMNVQWVGLNEIQHTLWRVNYHSKVSHYSLHQPLVGHHSQGHFMLIEGNGSKLDYLMIVSRTLLGEPGQGIHCQSAPEYVDITRCDRDEYDVLCWQVSLTSRHCTQQGYSPHQIPACSIKSGLDEQTWDKISALTHLDIILKLIRHAGGQDLQTQNR